MSTRRSSCSGVPLQGTRLWFKGREWFQVKSCSMQQDDALIAELIHSHRPAVSAEVITMFMAMIFMIGGLFQLIGSMIVAYPGWGWQAADGLITFLLGLLLIARWPATGLWVIGLFIGINLIVYGIAWIALALGLRGS